MTPSALGTYLNLCTQVYDLSKPKPPEDAYAFYRSYVQEASGAVLEPMCGTGRFLLPLVEEGFDVQGFDASEHMLRALHAKALQRNLKLRVNQDFVEHFKSGQLYDLIFIPSGSLCLLTDPGQVKAALKSFYDQLCDSGLLVFEVETINALSKQVGLWRASVWHRESEGMIMASFLDLPLKDNIATTICKYELIEGFQLVHTEIEELNVRLYQPECLRELLKHVGFKEIRILKGFDRARAPDASDEAVVFECKK